MNVFAFRVAAHFTVFQDPQNSRDKDDDNFDHGISGDAALIGTPVKKTIELLRPEDFDWTSDADINDLLNQWQRGISWWIIDESVARLDVLKALKAKHT